LKLPVNELMETLIEEAEESGMGSDAAYGYAVAVLKYLDVKKTSIESDKYGKVKVKCNEKSDTYLDENLNSQKGKPPYLRRIK
ncbi:MAG: hypothetical protein KDD56_09590, partial [Bdellovibrionales bacterium]|nr:hypothetical protein [Bdellovibrionales bacterium]